MYPNVQFGIGPAVENGFYYDIDTGGTPLTDADFAKIEKKMTELAQKNEAVVRADISKADALKFFGDKGQTLKCELINDLEDGHITTYTQGNFTDLCRGPHIPSTGMIKAIKVMSLAGAYWRGDETRPQLTRVYGITFPKKKMLDEYLVLLETARSARRWNCLPSRPTWAKVCPCGFPRVLPCATACRTCLPRSRSVMATSR